LETYIFLLMHHIIYTLLFSRNSSINSGVSPNGWDAIHHSDMSVYIRAPSNIEQIHLISMLYNYIKI